MSLTALTELNQMLIRSALRFTTEPTAPTEEETEPAEAAAGNSIITATGTGGGVFLIPDTSGPPEFRGFAATDKFEFEKVVGWIEANADVSGMSTLVDAFVEDWAAKWRSENGISSALDLSVPTSDQLIGDDRFSQGAFWLPLTGNNSLPPVFRTSQEVVDEETGEATEVPLIATVDPLTGVEFIEETVSTVVGEDEFGGNVVKDREVVERIIASQLPDTFARRVTSRTGETNMARFLERRGILPGAEDPSVVPTITIDELTAMLEGPTATGGGTSTRRDISFDRDHLIDQVDQLWKSWYRQGAPQNRVESIVDSYIRQARAFWNGDGGQLNFDTFVRSKLRTQPLYRSMFRHKPEATSEEQFIADFEAPISQLGLRGDLELEQTRASVMSGGSPAAQFQRVSQTREAQLGGGFSQQLAQTLAGLGAGSRA